MQRSITYQTVVIDILLIGMFIGYISLSSIYLILPPMLAILSYFFYRSLQRNDLLTLIFIVILLLILEAEKGFWLGSSVIFFSLIHYYIVPKLEILMRCTLCIKGFFVFSSYIGFWFFLTIVNTIFLLPVPLIDWHFIFYLLIEFALLTVLT